MAGDQGTATGSPFERSDLLERVLHAFGWTAIVAVVAAIPFVVLTTGSFAIGQPLDIDTGSSTRGMLLVIITLGLVPGVYAAGVAHQTVSWPLPVRLGIVGALAVIGALAGFSIIGIVEPGLVIPVYFGLAGAGLAVFLASPGLALLSPSDGRSYGRILVGVIGILLTLGWLAVTVVLPRRDLWIPTATGFLTLHGALLAAAWLGEGLGYDIADPDALRRLAERVRDRIDTVYAEGSIGVEDRDRWRDELDDLEAGFEAAAAEERVVRRLGRHGRIVFGVGVAFAVLAAIIWIFGLSAPPGDANAALDLRLAVGWLGSLAIGYAVSLPLLGIVAGSSASLRERDRSDLLETADERVDEIREEVLETVRSKKVEEDE